MSHLLVVAGTCFPPALPWAQGSLPVLAEGTAIRPESCSREIGKNNLPGWLLCRRTEFKGLRLREQDPAGSSAQDTSAGSPLLTAEPRRYNRPGSQSSR